MPSKATEMGIKAKTIPTPTELSEWMGVCVFIEKIPSFELFKRRTISIVATWWCFYFEFACKSTKHCQKIVLCSRIFARAYVCYFLPALIFCVLFYFTFSDSVCCIDVVIALNAKSLYEWNRYMDWCSFFSIANTVVASLSVLPVVYTQRKQ